ncbi:MAG: hypothetical protein SFW36_24210 [Leptolyngbyaceae cyanobacterium bins.59]|nr:hypothetical protein [Leptolyngbyaceae cyanobacterium bins.59]
MALKVFGQRPKEGIFLPQIPYAIRNDCQKGAWKIGDDDYRGNHLELSVIKVSQMFGTLGKTRNALWMQIWFVPAPASADILPANTVCCTHIKTRSISQFSSKVTELMVHGEPAEGIFIGSFEKHSSDLGVYYSVKWDWRQRETPEEQQQLEQIAQFMATHPPLIDMTTGLLCIDGMSAEEIELLIRTAKAEEFEEVEVQPKPALARSRRR